MRVTNVTISYLREYQPEKFQKATPFLEMSAVVDDGEDYSAVARTLMSEAVSLAYNTLGADVPAKIVDKLMLGKSVDQAVTSIKMGVDSTTRTEAEVPAELIETAAQPVEEDKPARRKRRTKAEMAADKAAEEAANRVDKACEDLARYAASEIPGEDPAPEETGRNISDNPEDRVNPEDSEIPGSDTVPAAADPEDVGKINVADIRSYVAKQLSDKKNSFDMDAYKKVLSENFDVIRTDDVPVDKLGELKELIDIAVVGI